MTHRPFSRIAILTFLLALTLSTSASGQPLADQWRSGLKEIDQKLRAGQWEAAEKQARTLSYRIAAGAGTGHGAEYSLAVVSAFRAFAAAGLGHQDDAAWHWDVALNIFPDIAKTDVSPYGPAAAELQQRRLRDPTSEKSKKEGIEHLQALGITEGKKVTPPRVLKSPRPDFPKALAAMAATGKLVVETIIGEDGRVHDPLVLGLGGGGPAMKYVTLDSLRGWKFEPATLEGTPVKVYYVLTINFSFKR